MTMTDESFLPEINEIIDRLARRIEARTRAVVDVDFIAAGAAEHWQKNEVDLYICESPAWAEFKEAYAAGVLMRDHSKTHGRWNGYARFPKLPGVLPGREGIYTYVPVHGGITFFQEWADGSVTYGFDCGHLWSHESPIKELGWVRLETESMARGIQIAGRFERFYLNAGDDNEKKARVLGRMGKFLPVEDIRSNLGIVINLLKGEL